MFAIVDIFWFAAGGALIWFCRPKIEELVIGANALSKKLHAQADALAATVLKQQRLGERVLGWCADDPVSNQPDAFRAAPGVSGATFPVKF